MGLLFDYNDIPHVFFPLVNQFGSQDSNYQWQPIIDEIISRLLQHDVDNFGSSRTSGYTDDLGFFGTNAEATDAIARIENVASIVGANPISMPKVLFASSLPIIGNQFDCDGPTMGVTESIFGKLLHNFYNLLPENPQPRDVIPLHQIQALASHAMRAAGSMTALRPFSKGFSLLTRGLPESATNVRLTDRAVTDIWMWRIGLDNALRDTTTTRAPISWPLLLRRLPEESSADRSLRQSLTATVIGYADACTTGAGIGVYIPDVGWLQDSLPDIIQYIQHDDSIVDTDINVLEFAAAVICAAALISSHTAAGHATVGAHFHIMTDNTSCLSWMTKYCAIHPLHSFLLQIFSHLQTRHGCLITIGHIPGSLNIYADAASRNFDCARGEEIRTDLIPLPIMTLSPLFIDEVTRISQLSASYSWDIAQSALLSMNSIITLQ